MMFNPINEYLLIIIIAGIIAGNEIQTAIPSNIGPIKARKPESRFQNTTLN
jgi:hypothetical protein